MEEKVAAILRATMPLLPTPPLCDHKLAALGSAGIEQTQSRFYLICGDLLRSCCDSCSFFLQAAGEGREGFYQSVSFNHPQFSPTTWLANS